MSNAIARLWRNVFGEPPPLANDARLLAQVLIESLPPAPPYRPGATGFPHRDPGEEKSFEPQPPPRRSPLEALAGVADVLPGTDVHQLAAGVEPQLAVDGPPAAAEGVVLAELVASLGLDHAVEQGVLVGTAVRDGLVVDVGVSGLGSGGDEAFEGFPLHQQEPAASELAGDEALESLGFGPLGEIADRTQLGVFEGFPGPEPLEDLLVVVDDFQRIQAGDDLAVEGQHPDHLSRQEADVRIDEHQVGGDWGVEEPRDQGVAAAGDEGVVA